VKVDFAALCKAIQEAEATEVGTSIPTAPVCVQDEQPSSPTGIVSIDEISTASGSTAGAEEDDVYRRRQDKDVATAREDGKAADDEDELYRQRQDIAVAAAVENGKAVADADEVYRQRQDVAVAVALEDAKREWEMLTFQTADAAEQTTRHAVEQFQPLSEDRAVDSPRLEKCSPAGFVDAKEGMLLTSEAPPRQRDLKPEELTPEDKAKVQSFLALRGFASITSGRRRFLKTNYPLHAAVAANDADLIRLLLRAGADPWRKNSSGLTPRQLAQKSCRRGSHAEVLRALDAAQ